MNPNLKKYLLDLCQATDCRESETIQKLWSGYGQIVRYSLVGAIQKSIVVKCISTSKNESHPKNWNTHISHQRKIKSYQIENHWYKHWSEKCRPFARIPKYIGSFQEEDKQWIIMEDLNLDFPLRKTQIQLPEIKTCLKWLACFHALFLHESPTGLWPIGTYWHLDTRPDELKKMQHHELKSKAYLINDTLNNCQYKSIVHGDAKLANFCFSLDGQKVAAVDFQYVGGGCGIKDVAYFISSCLDSSESARYENELLDHYFIELIKALKDKNIDCYKLEKEWREMYAIAYTDFTRFLMGWMPTHHKLNKYSLSKMETVLEKYQNQ